MLESLPPCLYSLQTGQIGKEVSPAASRRRNLVKAAISSSGEPAIVAASSQRPLRDDAKLSRHCTVRSLCRVQNFSTEIQGIPSGLGPEMELFKKTLI